MGDGGDLTVERWDGDAFFLPSGDQLAPHVCSAGVEAEDAAIHSFADADQPGLEVCFTFSSSQSLDTPAEFADGDAAYVQCLFILAQPCDHLFIRSGPGEFTKYVGINQIACAHGLKF